MASSFSLQTYTLSPKILRALHYYVISMWLVLPSQNLQFFLTTKIILPNLADNCMKFSILLLILGIYTLKLAFCLLPCLLSVAFFTLLERKVLGIMGLRLGPSKISLGGVLQPISDAGKLLNKEINSLINFSFIFYYCSSILMIFMSLVLLSMTSLLPSGVSFKMGLALLLLVLSLNSFNSILSGWSVYSKFSLLGSLRTVSQLISYEVLLYMVLFFFLFLFFSFDLSRILNFPLNFFTFLFPSIFLIWFLSVLAELNRTPYDFSEGESELVSGFNTDFGSFSFTMIFLAEYGNILFFTIFTSFLFFSGSYFYFFSIFFFFTILWIRSVLPRYRFDKLMSLSWKILLPFMIFLFLGFFSFLI